LNSLAQNGSKRESVATKLSIFRFFPHIFNAKHANTYAKTAKISKQQFFAFFAMMFVYFALKTSTLMLHSLQIPSSFSRVTSAVPIETCH